MAELDLNSNSLNPCLFSVSVGFCLYKMGNEEKERSWKINLSKEYIFSHNFQADLSDMLFGTLCVRLAIEQVFYKIPP